jgi:hypothetical protein
MKTRSSRSRAFIFAIAWLCSTGLAVAGPSEATDAAFAALLSMPDAQPKEGGWVIPEQPEPPPANERELIARLQQLKKAKANFDAMRHGGTLLAHAIRADKQRTALWLLQNGATPKRVLRDDTSTAYALARRFERKSVIQVLERQYGFQPPAPLAPPASASVPTTLPLTAAPVPLSRAQEARNFIDRIMPPHRVPSQENQQAWQQFAATLSDAEYAQTFENGSHLADLMFLQRDMEGGVENALSRLPLALVRRHAQEIADILAQWSFVEYRDKSQTRYTALSQSWPALWSRINQPLNYDKKPDLAGRIPPALWHGLFASGYTDHDAAVTGCLLSALDAPAFKAIWADFQRYFTNARQEAPSLVLAQYRLAHEAQPCYYSSTPADTVAKLAFLREQGVNSPLGLSLGDRQKAEHYWGKEEIAELAAMVAQFPTPAQSSPRLVLAPLNCKLAFNDLWLDELIKGGLSSGDRRPTEYAYAIDIPGQTPCGLAISGSEVAGWPQQNDDFFQGPFREGSFNCQTIELRTDGAVWFEDSGRIQRFGRDAKGGWPLRPVRDAQSGKHYLLSAGVTGALCQQFSVLPSVYAWQTKPLDIVPMPMSITEAHMLDGLLRQQCQKVAETEQVVCQGIDPPSQSEGAGKTDTSNEPPAKDVLTALGRGQTVDIKALVDALGVQRRQAYAAAVAERNHARVRQLLAQGIPAWWTEAEILALGKADLAEAEKRRRIAVLFANANQLERALEANRNLPMSLLPWLPDSDWGTVLRVIERKPSEWLESAQSLRNAAQESGRADLACRIDHALGFLCGGGMQLD